MVTPWILQSYYTLKPELFYDARGGNSPSADAAIRQLEDQILARRVADLAGP